MTSLNSAEILRQVKQMRIAGQDLEAVELLNEAIAHCPTAKLYYARGIQFDLLLQADKAVEDFTAALSLDPNNAEILLNRGCVLSHSLERDGKAIADFKKVIELQPNNVDAHRECCLCLLLLSDPWSAWDHALAALRLAPNDAVTHFCVGEVQMSLGLYDDAIKSFATAVEKEPQLSHYRAALGRAAEKARSQQGR